MARAWLFAAIAGNLTIDKIVGRTAAGLYPTTRRFGSRANLPTTRSCVDRIVIAAVTFMG